ncbi:MAG: pilus assembly PilX N-terminal domain-containing protein [Quisquiliibacterium sp.]
MQERSAHRQTGAATLLVTIIVLMVMTLITFFANRNILFETKTAANQYRSAKAIEAAEAGLEWAIANLNHMQKIGADCLASTAATDRVMRDKYLDPDGNGNYSPTDPPVSGVPTCPQPVEPPYGDTAYESARYVRDGPACTLVSGAWQCSCPAAGSLPTLASCTDPQGCPTFRLRFQNVVNCSLASPKVEDPGLVRITSLGCNDSQVPCVPGTAGRADASVEVTQVIKLLNGLATVPAAALTAKGNVDFGSNAITATNRDPGTNGITINAGGAITGFIGESTIQTLPGTPPAGSLVGGDTSLSSLNDDQMFISFFGSTKEAFKSSSATTVINCSGVCNEQVLAAIGAGARQIWIEGDTELNSNATFGSPTNPVMLSVNGNLTVRGTITIYGVVYCQDGVWDNTGGGTAQIIGAAIAEGSFTATGTPNPTYDPDVLANLRSTNGEFAKVPGGWRDF